MGLGGVGIEQVDVVSSSTDLFSPPPIERAQVSGDDVILHTVNSISTSPYEFHFPSETNAFVDMSSIRVEGTMRVVKKDNTNLSDENEDDKLVSMANLAPAGLFEQLYTTLNGVQINDSSSSNSYAYKAYMTTQLSYGADAKGGHLALAGYLDDKPGEEGANTSTNTNLEERRKWISGSKPYSFSMPVFCDLFHSERFLNSENELKLSFVRGNDDFILISPKPGNYKIVLDKLHLAYRKVKLEDKVANEIVKTSAKNAALYPIQHTKLHSHNLTTTGSASASITLFRGVLPSSIIIGFIKASAYDGDITENPWNFNHFNAKLVNLKVNGKTCPLTPYQPNFDKGEYAREARAFYDNVGVGHSNLGNISLEKWLHGNTFWAFDLTPDKCFGAHIHKTETGVIELMVHFAAAQTKPLKAVVFSVFNEMIAVGKDNQTLVSY